MLKFLLFIGLLASMHLRAMGCSCIGESTVEGGFKQASFVGVGTIKTRTRISAATLLKGAKEVPNLSANDTLLLFYSYKYTVEIEKVYKGNTHKKTVEIFTGSGGGDCGLEFSVGSSYIIYANSRHTLTAHISCRQTEVLPFLTTDICTRTAITNESELAVLRKVALR